MATSDNTSLKTPTSETGKKVGFAKPPRPKLRIPTPPSQASYPNPYSARTISSGRVTAGPQGQKFGRRASVFVFEQFNDLKDFTKTGMGAGEKCYYWLYNKVKRWSRSWFTHCFLSIVILLYTIGGAVIFFTIEGHNEAQLVERDINAEMERLLIYLRNKSLTLPSAASVEEWQGEASRRISEFELKITEDYDRHPLVVTNRDGKVWTMYNAVVYCATLYTTIGYGHIYPTTFTGRVLTMVYSTIGIPLFLIALTDFGKLFTRGIKYVWSYVRRLYHTGSCRRARKTTHVKEIFKGVQFMYEIATFRRPSMFVNDPESAQTELTKDNESTNPTTPAISNFEIDDEFNIPVTLALFILVTYIFLGALIYMFWEGWEFFPSFYFVFISMSTVGFGDYVPAVPACMISSIIYLCFGLALMSMCFNVVQEKLEETFSKASNKLGAVIDADVEDDVITVCAETVELAEVHNPVACSSSSDELEVENGENEDPESTKPESESLPVQNVQTANALIDNSATPELNELE